MKRKLRIVKNVIKSSLLCFALLFSCNIVFPQGASVNTSGNPGDPSAMLDVSSTTSGMLIPRMTTVQRNAIVSPAEGLMIYNLTTKCFETYISPMWQSIFCGCNPPVAPTAGTNTPAPTGVIWNWNSVSGATGYKYNTISDYYSAIDNGTNTSYTQTGLTCNTPYGLYVWAYSTCGNSLVTTLNQTTSACFACGGSVTFTYKGSSVTHGTVIGQNGTCWMDRNLGATAVATAYNHAVAYGDLFQWGRGDDGHQTRTSGSTTTLSNTDSPGHSKTINCSSGNFDWRNPQNDILWQGISGINNPCPSGWRLPTSTELDNERASWSSQTYTGAINSPLKLPTGGVRFPIVGNEASDSRYWSSTVSGTKSLGLYFNSGTAIILDNYRVYGCSVRCIKD